jgi:hypothetical protein
MILAYSKPGSAYLHSIRGRFAPAGRSLLQAPPTSCCPLVEFRRHSEASILAPGMSQMLETGSG